MNAPTEPAPPPSRPRKPRFNVTVRRVQRLTPRVVCVTFGGEALAGFNWSGPASHVKLFFGTLDVGERTSVSAAGSPPVVRTYTPRRLDPVARELDVEFVIHGDAPASAWAQQASVGQLLVIAGPGRSYTVDPAADWYLLAGDDTALPALKTILEVLPASMPVLMLIEVVDAAEVQKLPARAGNTSVQWLYRGENAAHAGNELEAAVRTLQLPSGSGRIYVACEADAMRRIRRHLLNERGLPRDQLVTRGYWRLGESDHPDRDYGEDVG